jgi:hypothetical protein
VRSTARDLRDRCTQSVHPIAPHHGGHDVDSMIGG